MYYRSSNYSNNVVKDSLQKRFYRRESEAREIREWFFEIYINSLTLCKEIIPPAAGSKLLLLYKLLLVLLVSYQLIDKGEKSYYQEITRHT